MRSSRFLNGWVFSPRTDLILFGAPVLVGWLLLMLHAAYDLNRIKVLNRSLFVAAFAFAAFLDTGHLLSTAFRSYLDAEVRRQRRVLLFAAPPLIGLAGGAIYVAFGAQYFLYVVAYMNLYHIVRQQYGWLAFSRRRGGESSGIDRPLDKYTLYAAMILPALWTHVFLGPSPRRIPVAKSEALSGLIVCAFVVVIGTYLARQAYKMAAGQPLNPAKLLLVLSTAATWGAVMFLRSPFLPLVASLYHSVPYLGLIYISARNNGAPTSAPRALFGRRYSWGAYAVVVVAAGYLGTKSLHVLDGVPADLTFGVSLVVFTAVIPVMHYLIDGVIWKRRAYNVLGHRWQTDPGSHAPSTGRTTATRVPVGA
jgi:hypothetical protein